MINRKRHEKPRTIEGLMLSTGKKGDSFYCNKKDKYLTSKATYYNRKIKTLRLIAFQRGSELPKAELLTKVILIDNPKN